MVCPRAVFRNESFNVPDRLIVCLSESDSDFDWAFTAACVLHTLDYGAQSQKSYCLSYLDGLRRSRRGRSVDPLRKMCDPDFLEAFIKRYAPDWNWLEWRDKRDKNNAGEVAVKQFVGSAQPNRGGDPRRWIIPTDPASWLTLPGTIYYGSEKRSERIAKEQDRQKRHDQAWVNRFIPPDEAHEGMLYELRRINPLDATSWPTLRELKMATGIDERSLKQMIAALQPAKGEIVRVARRRRFAERGAWPKRFAPRIVIGVLKEFRRQWSTAPDMIEEDRKRVLDRTTGVIRSLAAKSSRYR